MNAWVPGDGHGADAEFLVDRRIQGIGIPRLDRCRRYVDVACTSPQHLVKHPIQVFGQHRDLLLLAGNAGDAIPLPGLQKERPFTGLTNCPCHESIGRVVAVHQNRHALQGKPVPQ